MIWLRSAAFAVCIVVMTPPFALAMLLGLPFGRDVPYAIARFWCRIAIDLVRVLCGVKYRVMGTEHIPSTPTIVLSKHQSAWETFFFPLLFPRQVHVVKRELLRIPFFGWGLAMMNPIAIDRASSVEALRQVEAQGRQRLARGSWIIIFPEGTRMAPGTRGRYGIGGAWLAARTGTPVLPVAHNAGECWRRNAFLKYPGTITVSIGPAIDPRGLRTSELQGRIEHWIEAEMQRIGGPMRSPPAGDAANAPITQ